MQLEDFNYNLPEELIAQKPLEPRNSSRLMVLNPATKEIRHEHFYDLQKFLTAGDALIFNDTRVIPARLIGNKIIFEGYGYGHGVGMSQNGANAYAKHGWNYKQILAHYYRNTILKKLY